MLVSSLCVCISLLEFAFGIDLADGFSVIFAYALAKWRPVEIAV